MVGGLSYAGGELLRLLLGHPEIEVQQVTSRSLAKKFVTSAHPNLRSHTKLKFIMPGRAGAVRRPVPLRPHGSFWPVKPGSSSSLPTS
ncbi:MAG: hypothetical protein R2849_10730 [Thermomicrobiales bacterium]